MATIPILFKAGSGGAGLEKVWTSCLKLLIRPLNGANILILSDRDFDQKQVPIPALLAVSGLHHHLIRTGNGPKSVLCLNRVSPGKLTTSVRFLDMVWML
jgi:hypothetical protein